MSGVQWRGRLLESVSKNNNYDKIPYMQLATVRGDGRPANRSVAFQGFHGGTTGVLFQTDSRSPKAAEISLSSWVEACMYLPDTQEQFRLHGQASLHGADTPNDLLRQERCRAWAGLPHEIREWFSGPPPSQIPKSPPEAFHHAVPGPKDSPADSFVLGLIDVMSVDYLDLQQGRRQLFTRPHPDERWSLTETCA
ncbi:hypothetical protein WJX74_007370 [Apatococcus lobatus]|uniref:Pyridoxamine 5'-phosphate oxidase Alr4036 family FMN-binding domain-containing protein n=1 Tax=Apatococcus lobatus TaxID=904363 RepID=A0AAW1SFM9_9CHLO